MKRDPLALGRIEHALLERLGRLGAGLRIVGAQRGLERAPLFNYLGSSRGGGRRRRSQPFSGVRDNREILLEGLQVAGAGIDIVDGLGQFRVVLNQFSQLGLLLRIAVAVQGDHFIAEKLDQFRAPDLDQLLRGAPPRAGPSTTRTVCRPFMP